MRRSLIFACGDYDRTQPKTARMGNPATAVLMAGDPEVLNSTSLLIRALEATPLAIKINTGEMPSSRK
jgi:hypothetical protein